MSPSALEAWLLRRGTVVADALEKAQRRQRLYGGGLDTVLLEQGALEEEALRRALAEATGLAPGPDGASDPGGAGDAGGASAGLDAATARALGAVPLGRQADRLTLLVHLGSPLEELFAWAASAGLMVEPVIVPEVRFEAAFASRFGVPLAPRHVALLGKLLGRDRVRQWATRHAPPQWPGPPPVETGPVPGREVRERAEATDLHGEGQSADQAAGEAHDRGDDRPELPADGQTEARAHMRDDSPLDAHASPPPIVLGLPARTPAVPAPEGPAAPDPEAAPTRPPEGPTRRSTGEIRTVLGAEAGGEAPDPEARRRALRGLRPQLGHPKISARLVELRARVAAADGDVERLLRAISDLAALADPEAVPILFDRLKADDARVSQAAHAALVEITKRDFGATRWRWGNWWRQARHKHRIEWLIDALGGRSAELRLAAALELEQLGTAYVGYHFDLGKRDREEARRRWLDWWETAGRARFDVPRGRARDGGERE